MTDTTPTYRFAPRHESGILGCSRSQVVAASAGVLLALVAVLGARQPVAGLGFLALGAALAFTPVGGRPLVSWWAPVAARVIGRRGSVAPPRQHELHLGSGVTSPDGPSSIRWHLPGVGRLLIRPVRTPVGEVGVADLSGSHRAASVTFALSGPRFGLADPDEQARALGSWGQLLGALARDSRELQRLQLTERLVPDDLSPHFAYLADVAGCADPTAAAVYRAELDSLAGSAVRHEVLLTATLGRAGRSGSHDVVATECGRLAHLLDHAGFVARPLSADELGRTLRSILDPDCTQFATLVDGAAARHHAPQAWHTNWGSVVTDSGHHASFEASGLPRLPVGPEWAWPLVLADQPVTHRTLALHLELARPDLAIRRAERAVLSEESDEAMRARWGFRSGARQDQAHDAALSREVELATGFADARFALVVTVSATNEAALADACRALVSQGAQSHVELRRCYGRQAEALVASLPLGVVHFSGGWR